MPRPSRLVLVCALVVAPLLLPSHTVSAQPARAAVSLAPDAIADSARREIDRAVEGADSTRLTAAMVLLDRALTAFPDDPRLTHYRGYAAYRQALAFILRGRAADASRFVAQGITDLNRSVATLAWPESYALLSALTGFQIAADPSRGAELGMEIGMLSQKAMQTGASNPRVLLLSAQGAANTPPEYGGGVEPARALLRRAIAAFETDRPAPLAPSWGREEAIRYQKVIGM